MYGWKSAGGWNKENGQIERASRIDSFEIPEYDGFVFSGGVCFNCWHETTYRGDNEVETAELRYEGWRQIIQLSRVQHGFGGSSAYWLCPRCGKRCRYLYFKKPRFECRDCVELNYKSQQSTKNRDLYFMKAVEYATRYLEPPPPDLDGFSFMDWTPKRPKGQHWSTYRKHLQRFTEYQNRYIDCEIADTMRILRIFK